MLTSSSSRFDSGTFTLNATSQNANAYHYVYQSLETDASIVARVPSLTTNNPDASAGLMLRQTIEANSPYVYLALSQSGIELTYTEGGDPNNLAHVSGSSATTPHWLKLERKEGSVYVYESDDGINFALITTIALTISNPYQLGLATSTMGGQVQAQFEEVLVRAETEEVTASFTATHRLVQITSPCLLGLRKIQSVLLCRVRSAQLESP